MTVVYKYKDLDSVADYFENKAREARASLSGEPHSRNHKDIGARERAATLEMVANMLRNTELTHRIED